MHRGAFRVQVSSGVRLAYASVGAGAGETPPVVLLHAWGESRRSFDRLLALPPPMVHAVAIDQRGHGDSDRPATGYSLAESAEDVVGVMDALGLPPAVLLGSSSGGYVAQQVAATRPDRVAGLVLAGSPRSLQGRPPFADAVDRLRDPVDEGWVRESLTWFPRSRPVPDWFVEDRVRDGARIPARVWRASLDGLCGATPPTELARITAPTLVLRGEDDALLTGDDAGALARAIPGARVVGYEDTGHLVLWEQPERLAADLAAFVATLRPRPR